jgi:hypothetical protein
MMSVGAGQVRGPFFIRRNSNKDGQDGQDEKTELKI